MPAFHPPLASTTPVPVPDDAPPGAFAQLTFTAAFDPQEDTSGKWEIWTDLPRLGPDGTVHSHPGEWHAATFLPADASHAKVNGNGPVTTSAITIPQLDASRPASASAPGPKTFSLTLAVPATSGGSYSYTFRHLTTDGELRWLGGLGGNGVVRFDAGASGPKDEGVKVGDWPVKLDGEDLAWRGVGVELLEEKNGASIPKIRPIPSDIGISPTLVLLSATPASHLSAFSKISSSHVPLSTKPPTHNLALIAPPASPLTISPESPLPTSTSSADAAPTYGLSKDSPLREALQAAYTAAKPDNSRFVLGELAHSSEEEVDLAAAFFLPGQVEGGLDSAYLAVHSPNAENATDVAVLLPEAVGGLAPLAVLSEGTSTPAFIPAPHSEGTPRQINLHLPEGSSAALLRLVEFIELRATGEAADSAEAVWICAPDAVGYELGEEEVESASGPTLAPAKEKKAAALQFIALPPKVQTLPKDVVVSDEDDYPIPGGFITPQPKQGARADYGAVSDTADESEQQGGGGTWWFFRVISKWFVDFWNLLLSPFRKTKRTITLRGEGEQTDGDEGEDGHGEVDERTGLLDSDLSRATSSTAVSPAVSPSRGPGIKSLVFSATEQEPEEEEEEEPLRTVEIRSYTQLTFDHPSPWRFFLPPASSATVAVQEKLRFRAKEKGGEEWDKVVVDVKDGEGECVELLAKGEGVGEGQWDVEIERV
ncbi:hypothetical protein IAT38_003647 [Cryptococcus sp. DSM 104549]